MQVSLNNTGKRYNKEWIFRHVAYTFQSGRCYAITGPNGSGKSTLLQCIAGAIDASEGSVQFEDGSNILPEKIYQHLAIAAPYLEVIEEMTATEFLNFHTGFKPFVASVSVKQAIEIIGLEKAADKQIRYYSSGMKQRIKLAQAIFSDVPVLLLDEPCTNLDTAGYELYHQLIKEYTSDKLVIISSNDAMEMDFCSGKLNIQDWK